MRYPFTAGMRLFSTWAPVRVVREGSWWSAGPGPAREGGAGEREEVPMTARGERGCTKSVCAAYCVGEKKWGVGGARREQMEDSKWGRRKESGGTKGWQRKRTAAGPGEVPRRSLILACALRRTLAHCILLFAPGNMEFFYLQTPFCGATAVNRRSVIMGAGAIPGGVVHRLPADLRGALSASAGVLRLWRSLTPLARNEFICGVEDAKLAETRARRVRRAREELESGLRRPCCWPGCKHRARGKGAPAAKRKPL